MIYRCPCCKSMFSVPEQRNSRENLDGENGWWLRVDLVCPYCGEEEIEEVKPQHGEV